MWQKQEVLVKILTTFLIGGLLFYSGNEYGKLKTIGFITDQMVENS